MGMDVFGKAPTKEEGEYFRANIWSWRPIHDLCEQALGRHLPWGTNDGEGFDTQDECNELADKLAALLATMPDGRIEMDSDVRVSETGTFLAPGDGGGRSAYSTDKGHVENFISFLRSCGGFSIR